ncbi:hypothetical protein [Blastococcus haudaquaticus]|uniref:Uncharacterized protein n=1 Tax=Blastococcus haudaquaticus TaxID=1938745 RepID=A0A286GCI6_9ACTN|nr:hypothetical protein [Blastococcus haudaquaticus]SOD93220.1 hypothetical protein SAMN06272739_0226 [Blastococcus haudaquaticus]
MTIMRAVRPAVALALALGLAACAERDATGGPGELPESSEAAVGEGLVLRVEQTGGFVTPSMLAGRLPMVSVYADGRVITEGPVIAIHPGPALPNLQVAQLDPAGVQDLVDRALAAGVDETTDLGSPPVADATSTRFTVVTTEDTYVREVYALWETTEGDGLTDDQVAAREELSGLLDALTTPGDAATSSFEPEAVAAIASPWVDPGDGLVQAEQPWPGPALPGEPTGGPPDVTCVTATGAQAQAVLDAAGAGNAATPWVTGDGSRWSVTFRPLLPDETGCADLGD